MGGGKHEIPAYLRRVHIGERAVHRVETEYFQIFAHVGGNWDAYGDSAAYRLNGVAVLVKKLQVIDCQPF